MFSNTNCLHGFALAPYLGKGYTTNVLAPSLTIFDIKTLKPISTVATTGKNPDSILYDPDTKRVFTFNGRSANSTVIDATTGKVVGTVPLGGKPETPVLDGKGSIIVKIETNLTRRRSLSSTRTRSRAARALPGLPWTPPRVASSSAAATAT
jgi:YVTN family beta-propeller protein